MKNLVQVGGHTLTFSTYAVRHYCTALSIGGQPEAILISLLQGEFVTLVPMINAGLRATAIYADLPYMLPERTADELYEKLAEEGRVDEVVSAFAGSVVNKPTEEVGEYLETYFQKLADEMQKDEDDSKAGVAKKKAPLIRPSLTGKLSKKKPMKSA